jgi:circadian clock protein KaiC
VARAKVFTLGVPALAEFIGDIISPYTLLVAGHPGAGKTTLATTICYYNAIGGHKCLYVTFYEDKEKYYRNMKRLGLDLAQVESTGNFKFIRMPSTLDIELVVGEINGLVKEGYDVVVIDSMTALLEPVASNPEKRAWLLNYFYQLPMVINGLLVLVAELPFGMERLELGSIEFVVDAIIVLKQRVEDGFLTRILEVRKTREAPIQVAEIPFSIVEDVGVKIYPPIVLKEVPPEGVEVQLVCKKLKESVGHYHRGFIINIFSPQGRSSLRPSSEY